ncbi:OmpP1/FadL family transporter [Oryzibacter oryziterrae]|uniref:OmpP1/FadL family transporter n=1 Tax=Oryzibacter oryziterrae TaxID=2766474 RepID=UPI001F2EF4D8|nr:outer membrane protein transport protein [Oryzibacter oryziterrae]
MRGFATTLWAALLCGATGAHAGGFDTGQQNIDLLFDESDYVFNQTNTVVGGRFHYSSFKPAAPSAGGGSGTGHISLYVPRVDMKIGHGPVDCLGTYTQPFKSSMQHDYDWMGSFTTVDKSLTVDEVSLTCSYALSMGAGAFRLIGGMNYDWGAYDQTRNPDFAQINPILTKLDVSASGAGWRGGVAYELPDTAFRASLMYYSDVSLDATGTVTNLWTGFGFVPSVNVKADRVYLPQAVELRAQTGIAQGWLLSGAVKWQDWSTWQDIGITATPSGTPLTTLHQRFRDSWTVNLGLAHKFTDDLSGGVGLTWNQGVSTGYNEFPDTWTLTTGLKYALSKNIDLTVGVGATLLTAGSMTAIDPKKDYSASWDNNYLLSAQVGLKAHF